MKRSPKQQFSFVAAGILGIAPLALGLFRAITTGDDYRMFWMALAVTIFAAGVLGAAVGRRRSLHAALVQAMVILIVSTLLAASLGWMLGAQSLVAVGGVAFGFGLLLATASYLVAISRSSGN
ncbi:MAG: hypothetical protein H0U13_03920 [Gemmatimonadaceae bacterium]|nr:hypothetical protein [Gemmatimonadaceae bacterium]